MQCLLHSKIKMLSITNCGLKNLTPYLKEMSNLKLLNVSDNELESLEGVQNCNHLAEIYAVNNKISHIRELSSLKKLKVLVLNFNNLETFSAFTPVRKFNLEILDIKGNPICQIKSYISKL
jgi:Leucine-rich repeat (LRR) protein